MLEVVVTLSAEEVDRYRQQVVDDVIDPETDEPIPGTGEECAYHWFEIPAAVVNARTVSRRILPPDERRELMI